MSYVTHLESTHDGTRLPADRLQTTHGNRPLLVRYDLDAVSAAVTREELMGRPADMWRWRELLPLRNAADLVSLGEAETPLLDCPRLAAHCGLGRLRIKDESRLPGGSFKARGMSMAVSMCKGFGVTRVAVPTAGNAGGALAAYAARAGIECFVFMPADTPVVNRIEALRHGAKTFLVDGLIHDCARIVRENQERMGWFDMSTLREPYRIEGKKTMGLELAAQCDFALPDAILYPTGGGTGLIGMHLAFAQLASLGWLATPTMPRLISCQSKGCAPIAEAFERGLDAGVAVPEPHTLAAGIRVPKALGDFLVLRAVRESGGAALSADEDRLVSWCDLAMRLEGIALCPESAACLGTIESAMRRGTLRADDDVVLFNTGSAFKYVEALAVDLPRFDPALLQS